MIRHKINENLLTKNKTNGNLPHFVSYNESYQRIRNFVDVIAILFFSYLSICSSWYSELRTCLGYLFGGIFYLSWLPLLSSPLAKHTLADVVNQRGSRGKFSHGSAFREDMNKNKNY